MASHRMDQKILAAFERISVALATQMREVSRELGLAPRQAQLLLYLSTRPSSTVTDLAQTFGLSKPSVSIAIGALERKKLIEKTRDPEDQRTVYLTLTEKGEKAAEAFRKWTRPFLKALEELPEEDTQRLLVILLQVIHHFYTEGLLHLQRTCMSCLYLGKNEKGWYCNFLKKPLPPEELRIDCEDFVPAQNHPS